MGIVAFGGTYLLFGEAEVDNLDDEKLEGLHNGFEIRRFEPFVERKVERLGEGVYGLMDELMDDQSRKMLVPPSVMIILPRDSA